MTTDVAAVFAIMVAVSVFNAAIWYSVGHTAGYRKGVRDVLP